MYVFLSSLPSFYALLNLSSLDLLSITVILNYPCDTHLTIFPFFFAYDFPLVLSVFPPTILHRKLLKTVNKNPQKSPSSHQYRSGFLLFT